MNFVYTILFLGRASAETPTRNLNGPNIVEIFPIAAKLFNAMRKNNSNIGAEGVE